MAEKRSPPTPAPTEEQRIHIIWDWNGTLLDDAEAVIAATIAVFRGAGLRSVTPESYREHFTRPIPLFYERLLGRMVDPEEWSRLDHAFHHHYHGLLTACTLSPGAVEALDEVDRRGWTQSLCSLFPHEKLIPALELHGIAGRFERIDGLRGERGGRKADHLREHLSAMGVSSAAAMLIGDTVDDASAAQITGAGCVLLDTGTGLHMAGALRETGLTVVPSLARALVEVSAGRAAPA